MKTLCQNMTYALFLINIGSYANNSIKCKYIKSVDDDDDI